jgi:glycosyltransferase involved in cell wall biosynthesis
MRVLVNYLQCHPEHTGTGRYIRNLGRELVAVAGATEFVQLLSRDNEAAYRIEAPNFSQLTLPISQRPRWRRVLEEQTLLAARVFDRRRADTVLWSPNDVPLMAWPGRQVVTMHDVRRLVLPEEFPLVERVYYQAMMRWSAAFATRLLTVSEASRRDIHERFRVPLDRIDVAPNAVDPEFAPVEDAGLRRAALARHGVEQPYLLFAGHQLRVKSPHQVAAAFALLQRDFPQLRLVLVGKEGNATPLLREVIERAGLAARVSMLGWIPDVDLRSLMASAEAFVFPSLYEGFGIPLLEAMGCGAPVITARNSCLPEVCGDAALYVDAVTPEALRRAIAKLLTDAPLRRTLVERGHENVRRYSWRRSAEQVHDTLLRAAEA